MPGVHDEGVHAKRHRDQEWVVAWSGASLLQVQRAGGLHQQEDAQEPGKGQGRTGGQCLSQKFNLFLHFCVFEKISIHAVKFTFVSYSVK